MSIRTTDIEDLEEAPTADVDNTSIVELSLTLSKLKGHVNPAWATMLHQWMHARDACLAGAVALERGGKQQNLHVRGVLRMRMDPNDIEKLKNELKALIGWKRGDGSGTHMTLKQFVIEVSAATPEAGSTVRCKSL